MKAIIYLTIASLLLSACANPRYIEVNQKGDETFNCEQLRKQIAEANEYKRAAHEEDRFKLRYIFPPVGAVSVFRIMKADGLATRRIEHLNKLAETRECRFSSLIEMPNSGHPAQLRR